MPEVKSWCGARSWRVAAPARRGLSTLRPWMGPDQLTQTAGRPRGTVEIAWPGDVPTPAGSSKGRVAGSSYLTEGMTGVLWPEGLESSAVEAAQPIKNVLRFCCRTQIRAGGDQKSRRPENRNIWLGIFSRNAAKTAQKAIITRGILRQKGEILRGARLRRWGGSLRR